MDDKIRHLCDEPVPDSSPQRAAVKKNPDPTKAEMDTFYAALSKCQIKPIALILIPEYADSYVDESLTIPNVSDHFNQKYLNLTYPELLNFDHRVHLVLNF